VNPVSPPRATRATLDTGSPAPRRQRELQDIRTSLASVQAGLERVRDGTRELAEIELVRRLTPAEIRRARELRWESERLRHELQLLRERFETLAVGHGPPGPEK
jgi:hypothetical protein